MYRVAESFGSSAARILPDFALSVTPVRSGRRDAKTGGVHVRPANDVSPDIRAEISAAYAAWDSAFNKADAKALAAAYLPNTKLLPPTHEVISGPAEIENFFAGLFTSGFTDHNLTIIDAGGNDGVVYSAANWSAKGNGAEERSSRRRHRHSRV
ncbi:MAG: DUF4440 domain-containing protein [Microvirga sp.]